MEAKNGLIWPLTRMDIKQYLERIQFELPIITPDYITLEALAEQHLLHVPFENIDIQNHISIPLNTESFFEKVVANQRGGYCYELNGLFGELLTALGYDVTMISGRVARKNGEFGAEFDHLALIITIDKVQWLVDVGFGDFSVRPLAMLLDETQSDGRCQYRITGDHLVDGVHYYAAEKLSYRTKTFIPQYLFTLNPRHLQEFEGRHQYQQTAPDSHFTRNYLCSMLTLNGRRSIVNGRFYETANGTKNFIRIVNENHRHELLHKYFGIARACEIAI